MSTHKIFLRTLAVILVHGLSVDPNLASALSQEQFVGHTVSIPYSLIETNRFIETALSAPGLAELPGTHGFTLNSASCWETFLRPLDRVPVLNGPKSAGRFIVRQQLSARYAIPIKSLRVLPRALLMVFYIVNILDPNLIAGKVLVPTFFLLLSINCEVLLFWLSRFRYYKSLSRFQKHFYLNSFLGWNLVNYFLLVYILFFDGYHSGNFFLRLPSSWAIIEIINHTIYVFRGGIKGGSRNRILGGIGSQILKLKGQLRYNSQAA